MFFQSDLTYSSPKIMENELHMQLDHSNYIPIVNDVFPPCAFSEPLLHSTVGLPMFSSPFNNDANSQQEIPSDIFSYDYSSVFDHGLLSDHVNDHNRFLSQPELICGTSTSGFEPISVLSQNHNQENQWALPNYMTLGSNSRSNKFSTVISDSFYLGLLHQILAEMASHSLESIQQRTYSTSFVSFDDCFEDDGSFEARAESSYRRLELESKKSQLLGLLQMLDDCYNQCLDKIHSKTSALQAEDELDPQIHSTFALGTVSVFYKNLRERISKQILAMRVDRGSTRDKEKLFKKCFIQKQWALQQVKIRDQQLWRPQRGLPERSISVLRAWMFDNFLHPYPKDSEKHLLAIKSGLTRSQVSNWFINSRVRLWRPLVEEMSAEHNRRKGCRVIEEETNKNTGEKHQNQLSIYKKYKKEPTLEIW